MSNVLLHSLVFAPDRVSTAYIMTDLALELKKLGHTVTVLTTTPHYNVDQEACARQPMTRRGGGLWYTSQVDGIPVWHVTIPPKSKRVWVRGLDFLRFHILSVVIGLGLLRRQDVVISTSPPLSIGAVAWMLAARWGAPAIYKVAELYPDLAIRQGVVRGRLMIGLLNVLERFVYARNAMMVPVADQFTQIIRDRGVPEHKLRTIPDCVDVDIYRPLPKNTRFARDHGFQNDFVVLYGGNIGLVQDWESVLFAAEKTSDLPIRFVIVGDGVQRDWLAGEVERRKLSNVTLIGYQPKELMPEINASCDIGIVPLTYAGFGNGFPSKVYSNLASERPVIVSAPDGSEMAALITKAHCGRTVPPENGPALTEAVRRAYQQRDQLPEEGRRGRLLIEREYSKQSIAGRYDAVIRELTKQ